MAKKATITPVTDTVNNAAAINTQLNAINNKLDNTLSLDGSVPNAMGADLDMNSNDLLNVGTLQANDITVAGVDISTALGASVAAAATSATAASLSATQAAQYDGIWLDDVATLLADTTLTYTVGQPSTVVVGDYVRTRKEGFAYQVATVGDVTTAGGIQLDLVQQARSSSDAAVLATQPDGYVGFLDGLQYKVDSTATGTASATNDLGQDGLIPFGVPERGHFGSDAAFVAYAPYSSTLPQFRSVRISNPTAEDYRLLSTDRGLALVPDTSNPAVFTAMPHADYPVAAPNNTSLSEIRTISTDIENDPTGTRKMFCMAIHKDTDGVERGRLHTRSEGTPSEPHPDVTTQYNGANIEYYARKRNGDTGLASYGIFSNAITYKTGLVDWAASTAYVLADEVAVPESDYMYLECTTAGTSGGTVPALPQIDNTVVDNTVTWTARSRLLNNAGNATAQPNMWSDENGNTGFGTMAPAYDYHFAKTGTFTDGIRFVDGATSGAKLNNILSGSVVHNFGAVGAGASASVDITVTGAAEGNVVSLGIPWGITQTGIIFQAFVRSANNVRVEVQNTSSGSITLTSQTFAVVVFKL